MYSLRWCNGTCTHCLGGRSCVWRCGPTCRASVIAARVRVSGGEHASSLRGAGPLLHACPCQSVRLQIWFPSSSNRQQGWGRLSGILIVLLHVAKLHECGGRREQPAAMWGMREKPQEQGSLGFIGLLGRRQSPRDPKGWVAGVGESF